MANDIDSFIREGFSRFPEAYQAVDEFAKSLDLQVRGILKEVGDGPEFRVDVDRVRLNWLGDARDGHLVYWLVPATCKCGKVTLEVGYWWRPGRLQKHFLIAWGNQRQAPKNLSGYKPRNPDLKVEKVNYAWNGDRLYLPLDPTAAGGGEIRMLLEELIHWLNTEKPAAE